MVKGWHDTPSIAAPEQRALLTRLVASLRADERITAAWAIGSLADGGNDEYSDIDLLAAVRPEAFTALVADWPTFLAHLTPTVFARQLGTADKPTITAITPEWLRFDLTLAATDHSRPHGYTAILLFDTGGSARAFTFAPVTSRQQWDRLPELASTFLRVLGLLPIVLGRSEFLVGPTPVMLLRDYLIDLYLIENGSPRAGAKRLNALLSAEQRRALLDLPPLAPTRGAIIAGHTAIARLFLPHARRLAATHGLAYPEAFEQATLAHLQRTIGIAL